MSNDKYAYVVKGTPSIAPIADPIFASRHGAVGEMAILDALYPDADLRIVTRKRYATDPV